MARRTTSKNLSIKNNKNKIEIIYNQKGAKKSIVTDSIITGREEISADDRKLAKDKDHKLA